MPVYEVWEYGEGDGRRFRYERPSKHHAVQAFLDRMLVTGHRARDRLQDEDRLHVCVKDPRKKGTRDNPNYPDIHCVTAES